MIKIEKKTVGFIICSDQIGGYLECWPVGSKRVTEFNLYEGGRQLSEVKEVFIMTKIAMHWMEHGELPSTIND